MSKLIGRKEYIREFDDLYKSGKSEFVVVYGRRRVGKTFMINQIFKDKFTFCHTGLSVLELEKEQLAEKQLQNFCSSLRHYNVDYQDKPQDWFEAFDILRSHLSKIYNGERQVIFIDELPWLDTPRSGFITAFEHFWNGWGAQQDNLMLIVSGSATSWISNKLIDNHGGLYNRITAEFYLKPFTLEECEEFYLSNNIIFDRLTQLQSYMVFGGIPYYLSLLSKRYSLAQNIDKLMFDKKGKLFNEFSHLFKSLFINPEDYQKVVKILKNGSLTRLQIADKTKIPYGGGLTTILKSLEENNFISSYIEYGRSKRDTKYKLIDPYVIFYLNFIEGQKNIDPKYFESKYMSPELNSWFGLAFERVCFSHILKIKKALEIGDVSVKYYSWQSKLSDNHSQIDLLIDRADRVINLCEIKFSNKEFAIDKQCDADIRRKVASFMEQNKIKSEIKLSIITTYGLQENMYSGKIQNVVVMDDLF